MLDATRELAVRHDRMRWAREDLEDALLDLKLAVLDFNADRAMEHFGEALGLLAEIRVMLGELPEEN